MLLAGRQPVEPLAVQAAIYLPDNAVPVQIHAAVPQYQEHCGQMPDRSLSFRSRLHHPAAGESHQPITLDFITNWLSNHHVSLCFHLMT